MWDKQQVALCARAVGKGNQGNLSWYPGVELRFHGTDAKVFAPLGRLHAALVLQDT